MRFKKTTLLIILAILSMIIITLVAIPMNYFEYTEYKNPNPKPITGEYVNENNDFYVCSRQTREMLLERGIIVKTDPLSDRIEYIRQVPPDNGKRTEPVWGESEGMTRILSPVEVNKKLEVLRAKVIMIKWQLEQGKKREGGGREKRRERKKRSGKNVLRK